MSNSLLLQSVERGDVHMVAKLLEQNTANINYCNSIGQTSLHIATIKANVIMMKLLLAYGADLNATASTQFGGLAPLHIAARFNYVEVNNLHNNKSFAIYNIYHTLLHFMSIYYS